MSEIQDSWRPEWTQMLAGAVVFLAAVSRVGVSEVLWREIANGVVVTVGAAAFGGGLRGLLRPEPYEAPDAVNGGQLNRLDS